MGQEAYAMFPALAEMQARSQLMRAQAGQVGQDSRFAQQKYGQEQQALGVLGSNWGDGSSVPPVPGGMPTPPEPGQASQPMDPFSTVRGRPDRSGGKGNIRVPQPSPQVGGPAMQGPTNVDPSGGAPGSADMLQQPGDNFLPQAAQPPVSTPATPHKWTAQPGEQFDTPDGSRPRSFAEVIGAMRKANPKADGATLARAALAFLPWMSEEDQARLREETLKTNTLIAQSNQEAQKERTIMVQQAQTDRTNAQIGSREKIAYATLDLRDKLAAARNDERYAELTKKQDYWDQKIRIAQQQVDLGTNALAQRGLIAAQRAKHDAVYNLVSTMFSNGDMTEEERAAIQQQADQELKDATDMAAPAAKPAPAKGRAMKTTGGRPGIKVPGISTDPGLDPGTPARGFQ